MSGFLVVRIIYTHCMWFGKKEGNAEKKTETSKEMVPVEEDNGL